MNLFLAIGLLVGVALGVTGQEKGNSIIPFPRVGRAGNSMSPGLIPFPRIGRDSAGLHEVKRQLIPFPRVGKRMPWPQFMDPFYAEYEANYSPWQDMPDTNAYGAYAEKDDNSDVPEKKNGPAPNANGMWFGPRLGRKKRSIDSSESSSEHSRDNTIDTRTLMKFLRDLKWAIVPVKERRTFTPRLGRSSSEISVHTRAQPLTPRLGRSHELVSAELDVDDESQTRYTRSEEHGIHGRSTQQPPIDVSGPPFSPRLGRADHYASGRPREEHE